MATKHLLNERKYIKVPVKQKQCKRGLWNAELFKQGHRKCKCLSAWHCLLRVCAHTLMSQPGMDTTNFARLTTDVSVCFGSTSVRYNNTISCLLICNIIFQPYVFPIRALVPFSSFSITFALPAMDVMLLTNELIAEPACIWTETRAHWRNTTLSTEKSTTTMGGSQQYMKSSWAMPTRMVIQ